MEEKDQQQQNSKFELSDNIGITFNIFDIVNSKMTFIFDEPTEKENLEKLSEALDMLKSQIMALAALYRPLKVNGIEVTKDSTALFQVKITQDAGSSKVNVKVNTKEA